MKTIIQILFLIFCSYTVQSQISRYDNGADFNPIDTYVPLPVDDINRAYQIRRQQLKEQEEYELRNTEKKIRNIYRMYQNFNSYPNRISDGWHIVVVTNGSDFCEERKVYVQNNRVISYIIDNWINRDIEMTSNIENGKSILRLKESDNDYLELYFMNYIVNNMSFSTPPLKSGKVSFYTGIKRGSIEVYINEESIGTIRYYHEYPPDCGSDETVVFEGKPGEYEYQAISDKYRWKGTITIRENDCFLFRINK